MDKAKLTFEYLQTIFSKDQISKCIYIQASKPKVRLINSKPELSGVPALYPYLSEYVKALGQFSNVQGLRVETIDGVKTGSLKVDAIFTLDDLASFGYVQENLPPIPTTGV